MAVPSPDWSDMLADVDVIVHFAGNAHPKAGWPDMVGPNIDAPLNLYLAAARHGVRHIVLASSIWVCAGRRSDRAAIDARDADPGDSRYGATKLFAERLAHGFWLSDRIATTILRIGAYKADGETVAGLTQGWDAETRLSSRDLCEGVRLAIGRTPEGVCTINLLSRNQNARFTLHEAEEAIGYVPQDRFETPTPGMTMHDRLRRVRHLLKTRVRAGRVVPVSGE